MQKLSTLGRIRCFYPNFTIIYLLKLHFTAQSKRTTCNFIVLKFLLNVKNKTSRHSQKLKKSKKEKVKMYLSFYSDSLSRQRNVIGFFSDQNHEYLPCLYSKISKPIKKSLLCHPPLYRNGLHS